MSHQEDSNRAGALPFVVHTRFRVVGDQVGSFRGQVVAAVDVLAAAAGFRRARLSRSIEDPDVWSLDLEWDDVGSYRRGVSTYEAKVSAVPLLSSSVDEPTAFESLEVVDGRGRSRADTAVRHDGGRRRFADDK